MLVDREREDGATAGVPAAGRTLFGGIGPVYERDGNTLVISSSSPMSCIGRDESGGGGALRFTFDAGGGTRADDFGESSFVFVTTSTASPRPGRLVNGSMILR
jgi:hypothetical protein